VRIIKLFYCFKLKNVIKIGNNLEADSDEDKIMNLIFWINETLKNYHDLDLKDPKNWNLEE
jgi:hypothetical protein